MTRVTTLVIGAGQAGLAMSEQLSRRGFDHRLLERGRIGNAWRNERWNSLRLLTPNWANAMLGCRYAGLQPDGFMRVSEFVDHLDDYAASICAPVLEQTCVTSVTACAGGFVAQTNRGRFEARSLVLASGACAQPKIPSMCQAVPDTILQITPASYKCPQDLPTGGVLVVGASASGVQLAAELQASGRQVTLATGHHVRLPRWYRGRDIEWWLDAIGMLDESYDTIDDLQRARRVPSPQLIGGPDPVDLNALMDRGVEIVGRLMMIRKDVALFSGGLANCCTSADLKMHRLLDAIDEWVDQSEAPEDFGDPDRPAPTKAPRSPSLDCHLNDGSVETIVWATGFRPDFSWLDLPVFDPRGGLRHEGGVVDYPGVYAMGLPFMRRRRSHQITGVGDDAREIAEHLASFLSDQSFKAA